MKKNILKENNLTCIEDYFGEIVNMVILDKAGRARQMIDELSKDDMVLFDAWISGQAGGMYSFSTIESVYFLLDKIT